MTPEELQNRIRKLELEMEDLKYILNKNEFSTKSVFTKDISINSSQSLDLNSTETTTSKIKFNYDNIGTPSKRGTKTEMYQEENGGNFRIDTGVQSARVNNILLNDGTSLIYARDESILKADNLTNNTLLVVEPTRASFSTNGTNLFRLGLPNGSSNPTTCSVGDLCSTSGVLKICTASNTWTTVGTQV